MKKVVKSNLLCIVFLFVISVSLLLAKIFDCYFSSELASWLQAVGSILAVCSGFLFVYWQTKGQQEKRRREEQKLTNTAYFLIHDAFDAVCDRLNNARVIEDSVQNNGIGIKLQQMARTTEMIHTVRDFRVSHLQVDMLQEFIQIRSQLVAVNRGIDNFHKSREKKDKCRKDLTSSYRVLNKSIKSWEKFEEVAKCLNVEIKKCPIENYPKLREKLGEEAEKLKELENELSNIR